MKILHHSLYVLVKSRIFKKYFEKEEFEKGL
jgi:hypothetical protein